LAPARSAWSLLHPLTNVCVKAVYSCFPDAIPFSFMYMLCHRTFAETCERGFPYSPPLSLSSSLSPLFFPAYNPSKGNRAVSLLDAVDGTLLYDVGSSLSYLVDVTSGLQMDSLPDSDEPESPERSPHAPSSPQNASPSYDLSPDRDGTPIATDGIRTRGSGGGRPPSPTAAAPPLRPHPAPGPRGDADAAATSQTRQPREDGITPAPGVHPLAWGSTAGPAHSGGAPLDGDVTPHGGHLPSGGDVAAVHGGQGPPADGDGVEGLAVEGRGLRVVQGWPAGPGASGLPKTPAARFYLDVSCLLLKPYVQHGRVVTSGYFVCVALNPSRWIL
jgi:hypothetical protein